MRLGHWAKTRPQRRSRLKRSRLDFRFGRLAHTYYVGCVVARKHLVRSLVANALSYVSFVRP